MNNKKMISADLLKQVALITMFIDHIGAGIFEHSPALMNRYAFIDLLIRLIGRLAFPIFCFLITEGYEHTRSRKKYALNLLVFALISELPFDFLFEYKMVSWENQNVYFTLLFGLITICGMGLIEKKEYKYGLAAEIPILAIGATVAEFCYTDYGGWGVLLIGILFLTRKNRALQCWTSVIFILTSPFFMDMSKLEMAGAFSFILIGRYNGVRKRKGNKYLFYSLYPIHISLYCLIRYMIYTYVIF